MVEPEDPTLFDKNEEFDGIPSKVPAYPVPDRPVVYEWMRWDGSGRPGATGATVGPVKSVSVSRPRLTIDSINQIDQSIALYSWTTSRSSEGG
jgi:hypothetical protein